MRRGQLRGERSSGVAFYLRAKSVGFAQGRIRRLRRVAVEICTGLQQKAAQGRSRRLRRVAVEGCAGLQQKGLQGLHRVAVEVCTGLQ